MIPRFLPLLLPLLLLAPGCGREAGPAPARALPPIQSIDWRNPRQGLFSEDWYTVHVFGARAGYMHQTLTRKGDEVHTRVHMVMQIGRGAESMRTEATVNYRETVDGRPLGISSVSQENEDPPTTFEGSFQDGRLSYTRTVGGNQRQGSARIPPESVMAWGLARRMGVAGLEAGTSFQVPYYDPDLSIDEAFPYFHEVMGPDTLDYHGRKVETVKLRQSLDTGSIKMEASFWVREDFSALETQINMGPFSFRMELADEEAALAGSLGGPGNVLASSLVDLGREVPREARWARYRIRTLKGDPGSLSFPRSPSQSVEREGDEFLVTVRPPDPESAFQESSPLDGEERRKALEPNLYISSDHESVLDLLSSLQLPEGASELQRARALRRLVHGHIDEKNLSVGFAPADQVARDAEGDCSEHAVLLSALGRASGIPSRVATGLMYVPPMEGRGHAMGYHMWSQFHIGGRWLDFDAAVPWDRIGPRRLALSYSYLDDDSLVILGLSVLESFGNLEIELEDLE